MRDDGWFVIPAKLANGKEIDLFKAGGGGGPISFEKPTFVSRTFKDHRWRRYLMNLLSGAHQDKRLFYGRYARIKRERGERGERGGRGASAHTRLGIYADSGTGMERARKTRTTCSRPSVWCT